MNNLATSYAAHGRHEEALDLREKTLAGRRRILAKDHPDTLMSMNNLANSYADKGREEKAFWDKALALREETLAAQRRVLPVDHPDILMSQTNVANSLASLGRHLEALAHTRTFSSCAVARCRRTIPRSS